MASSLTELRCQRAGKCLYHRIRGLVCHICSYVTLLYKWEHRSVGRNHFSLLGREVMGCGGVGVGAFKHSESLRSITIIFSIT